LSYNCNKISTIPRQTALYMKNTFFKESLVQ